MRLNPLSANHTKWSNTLKHGQSVIDHFIELALKGLNTDNVHDEKPVYPCGYVWPNLL